jgi:hypothetical protein
MLIVDRVVCDLCHEVVGQLFNQPAEAADLLTDKRFSPEFTVCPDCYDVSEIAA